MSNGTEPARAGRSAVAAFTVVLVTLSTMLSATPALAVTATTGVASPAGSARSQIDPAPTATPVPAPVDPRAVWTEDFSAATGAAPIPLASYRGGRYKASSYWQKQPECNGLVIRWGIDPTVCGNSTSSGDRQARRNAQRMADVLGQVAAGGKGAKTSDSATPPTGNASKANFALIEWTRNGPGTGDQTADVFATVGPLSANGLVDAVDGQRFYVAALDVAEASCTYNNGTNASRLRVQLGADALTPTPLQACGDAHGFGYYTSDPNGITPAGGSFGSNEDANWGSGGKSVRAGTAWSGGSTLMTLGGIRDAAYRLSNDTTSGDGNDFAVDNLRILDATPSLHTAFDQSRVVAGAPATVTFTVVNTNEFASKAGWRFTAALPAGMKAAADPAYGGTCTSKAGQTLSRVYDGASRSLVVAGGALATGDQSCTITMNVVADAAGSYTIASDTTTLAGLNRPADATLIVDPATTLTVKKQLTAPRSSSSDQFVLSIFDSAGKQLVTKTTAGVGAQITGSIDRQTVTPGSTYTIHERLSTGAGLNYTSSYECTRDGTVIASGAYSSGRLTVPNEPGATIECTFRNSPQASAQFVCDAHHFYAITSNGAIRQGDAVTGEPAVTVRDVGTGALQSSNYNALALRPGAPTTTAYAVIRGSAANMVSRIIKFSATGTAEAIYTAPSSGFDTQAAVVAGAVDAQGRYFFGGFSGGQFSLWSFREGELAPKKVGTVAADSDSANGDMAFDDKGNLHILGAANSAGSRGATIFTVSAADLTGATGTIARSETKRGVLPENTLTAVNGIAFSSRGTAFLSDDKNVYEFDPTTWTRIDSTKPVAIASTTDLASCASPSTIAVQTNVVGRAAANDQFTMTLKTTGAAPQDVATATTGGPATGRQTTQIGPVPAPAGKTFVFSQGFTANAGVYKTLYQCWADGRMLTSGQSAAGEVTIPEGAGISGAAVTCTLFETPQPFATIRLDKKVIDALAAPVAAKGWTLSAAVPASSSAVFPGETGARKSASGTTDENGRVEYALLFADTSAQAVTVSEQQKAGFRTDDIVCRRSGLDIGRATAGRTELVVSANPGDTIECAFTNRAVATLTLQALKSGNPSDAWTLSATAPQGALVVPGGATGANGVTRVPVSSGVGYALAETGGPATYVQDGAWTCKASNGADVPVTNGATMTPPQGADVTCTVTNGTAFLSVQAVVQTPQGKTTPLKPADWTITATPAAGVAGLPAVERLGDATAAAEVRPGHGYTLSQRTVADAKTLAPFRVVGLQKQNAQGGWEDVSSTVISAPAIGQSASYRFVFAPIAPLALPLTGGMSTDAFLICGAVLMLIALTVAFWRRRRARGDAV